MDSLSRKCPDSTRQSLLIISIAKAFASFALANKRNLQPDPVIDPEGENLANLTKWFIVITAEIVQA
jgi:hypothetical protein